MSNIEKLCKAIIEMKENCEYDLVGEHREYYNPRIDESFKSILELYPIESFTIMSKKGE